jgi:hypothetical protein
LHTAFLIKCIKMLCSCLDCTILLLFRCQPQVFSFYR